MRDRRGNTPKPGGGAHPELGRLLDEAADCYRVGHLDAAAVLYRKAEALAPNDIRATYSLAIIDLQRSLWADARRRLKAVLKRQGDHFGALHNLGVAAQASGQWAAAADGYARALDVRPAATETAFNLAIALAVLGQTDEALVVYRRLADYPATRVRALVRMSILQPTAVTETELDNLKASATDTVLDAETRVGVHFALAGALEARREDVAAWEAFTAGNALKRRLLQEGPPETRPAAVAQAHALSVSRVTNLFTPDFLAAHSDQGDRSARPIFIVGMPRSGSSLVEQILASHPKVQGMGESGALAEVTHGRFPYPPDAPMAPSHFGHLARDYLRVQARRGWDGRTRLVDKTLDSHLQVGLIHLMFPRAVILLARRDPMDVGLACFRQLFAQGNETLYDLADIAAEIRRYDAVMDHWRRVAPGRVFEVRYEDLVAQPAGEIRRIVTEVCGLPWDPACLDFHRTANVVKTASATQVRLPIFKSSVARWRRYSDHLGPLMAGLKP